MKTKQKQLNLLNVIFGRGKQQGGTAVVAAKNSAMVPVRVNRPNSQQKAYSLVRSPSLSNMQYKQVAAMLAATVGYGLERFTVEAIYGRVYLIGYVPIAAYDPKLPFVFRDYGTAYQRAYRHLTDQFIDFVGRSLWDYQMARTRADKIISFVDADHELSQAEKMYFKTEMMYSISMPREAIA